MRMLRAGGWDGTAGKRSRGCQRAHARHGQEYATEAGVAWQGQGMLAIWRGGQHGGWVGDLFTCGRGGSHAVYDWFLGHLKERLNSHNAD